MHYLQSAVRHGRPVQFSQQLWSVSAVVAETSNNSFPMLVHECSPCPMAADCLKPRFLQL